MSVRTERASMVLVYCVAKFRFELSNWLAVDPNSARFEFNVFKASSTLSKKLRAVAAVKVLGSWLSKSSNPSPVVLAWTEPLEMVSALPEPAWKSCESLGAVSVGLACNKLVPL